MTDTFVYIDGMTLRLIYDAAVCNNRWGMAYEASAIDVDEVPDEGGLVFAYLIRWDIPEHAPEGWEPDWNCPDEISFRGDWHNQVCYNIAEDRFV